MASIILDTMLSVKEKDYIAKRIFTRLANDVSHLCGVKDCPMTDEAWLDPTKGPSETEVAFDYIKGPDFRVVWADGAVGSLTPNGLIHFVVFAERPAIPRRQVFRIEPDGTVGDEQLGKQISRGSIVREMACDVLMTAQTAAILAKWLQNQVKELNAIRKQQGHGDKK